MARVKMVVGTLSFLPENYIILAIFVCASYIK
jgi:hypothetical protein